VKANRAFLEDQTFQAVMEVLAARGFPAALPCQGAVVDRARLVRMAGQAVPVAPMEIPKTGLMILLHPLHPH
jgi:hypothetical protein